jgi:hypothetical protein
MRSCLDCLYVSLPIEPLLRDVTTAQFCAHPLAPRHPEVGCPTLSCAAARNPEPHQIELWTACGPKGVLFWPKGYPQPQEFSLSSASINHGGKALAQESFASEIEAVNEAMCRAFFNDMEESIFFGVGAIKFTSTEKPKPTRAQRVLGAVRAGWREFSWRVQAAVDVLRRGDRSAWISDEGWDG